MSYSPDPYNIIPQMTSDTTPSPFVASASGVYGAGFEAFRAFDRAANITHMWVVGPPMPQWVQIQMDALYVINKYRIAGPTSDSGAGTLNSPKDWQFLGSVLGSSFDTLDSQTGQSWSLDEVKEFPVTTSTGYRYFRLNVSDYNPYSYPYLLICEIEMNGFKVGNVENLWEHDYVGISTDSKPTVGIPEGARFWELDTKKHYLLIAGVWYDIT